MSNYFLINPKEERLNQLREEALNQMMKGKIIAITVGKSCLNGIKTHSKWWVKNDDYAKEG